MQLSIRQPVCFSQIGKRSNNEDSLFPSEGNANAASTIFLVCDGVGGSSKGEVASSIVSKAVAVSLGNSKIFSESAVEQSVKFAHTKLQEHLTINSDTAGMATTLTCLWLHNQGATIAHLGDSRIYHIRKEKILHCTADHSLVGEMVKKGLITMEEAKLHSRKNVITKAVVAGEPFTAPDIYTTSDIEADDYFFICSDGVLESVSDYLLIDTLNSTDSLQKKMTTLQQQCLQYSSDNNSAYLVQISDVQL